MSILGEVAKTRVKDMAFVQRMKNRQRMQLGMKANKFQPHFRCQVMFWRSCSKGHLWRSFVIHVLSSIFQSFIHVTWSYKSILCIWCRHRAFGVGGSCPPPHFCGAANNWSENKKMNSVIEKLKYYVYYITYTFQDMDFRNFII